ncbi:hypothetical protein ACVIGB_000177 [Bradyrhizobium sp. USDA 4341]
MNHGHESAGERLFQQPALIFAVKTLNEHDPPGKVLVRTAPKAVNDKSGPWTLVKRAYKSGGSMIASCARNCLLSLRSHRWVPGLTPVAAEKDRSLAEARQSRSLKTDIRKHEDCLRQSGLARRD